MVHSLYEIQQPVDAVDAAALDSLAGLGTAMLESMPSARWLVLGSAVIYALNAKYMFCVDCAC